MAANPSVALTSQFLYTCFTIPNYACFGLSCRAAIQLLNTLPSEIRLARGFKTRATTFIARAVGFVPS